MLDSDKLSQCIKFMESNFPNWEIFLNSRRKRLWNIIASFINADHALNQLVTFWLYSDKTQQFSYLSLILQRFESAFTSLNESKKYIDLFAAEFLECRETILKELIKEIEWVPEEVKKGEDRFVFFKRIPASSLEAAAYRIIEHYEKLDINKLERHIPYDHYCNDIYNPEHKDINNRDSYDTNDQELVFYINLIGKDEAYRYEEVLLNDLISEVAKNNRLYLILDKDFDQDLITSRKNIYCIKEYKSCVIVKYSYDYDKYERKIEFLHEKKTMDLPVPTTHLLPHKYLMIDEWKIMKAYKNTFLGETIPFDVAETIKKEVLEFQNNKYREDIPALYFDNNGIHCPVLTGQGKGKSKYTRKAFIQDYYDKIVKFIGMEEESNHLIVSFLERILGIEIPRDIKEQKIYPVLNEMKNGTDNI